MIYFHYSIGIILYLPLRGLFSSRIGLKDVLIADPSDKYKVNAVPEFIPSKTPGFSNSDWLIVTIPVKIYLPGTT